MSKRRFYATREAMLLIIIATIPACATIAAGYLNYRGQIAQKELEISATQTAEYKLPINATLTPTIQYMPMPIDVTDSPTLSITSVPSATHTPSATFAPSATDSPRPTNTATEIDTPTEILTIITPSSTPTPTSISSLNYVIADCINASAWYFQPVSISPPRDINQPNCLDLSKWGFAAQNRNLSDERQGLRINVDASAAATHGIYIFLPNEKEIDLLIEIDELAVKENCADGKYCDANLIFGIGDPVDPDQQGWFLFYRATNKNSPRLTCFLNSVFTSCDDHLFKESPPFEATERSEIKFTVNRLDVVATIDGATFNGPSLSGITSRIFWIGYNFRSEGSIRAFVSFSK